MKLRNIMLALVVVSLFFTGCGTEKAASGRAAITEAKTMQTAQEKTDYLIAQANAFYKSKEYKETVELANYVLRYVDRNSPAAKAMLEKAQAAIKAQAQKAIEETKKRFSSSSK